MLNPADALTYLRRLILIYVIMVRV